MIKKILQIFSSLSLLLSINHAAQAQYFYLNDNSVGSITASEKGDLKIAAFTPFRDRLNFHFVYSPIKHLSFAGGLFDFKDQRTIEAQTRDISGKTFTGSVGFYYFFQNPDQDKKDKIYQSEQGFLLSCDLGYAKGSIVNKIDDFFFSDLAFQKVYGQIGLRYKTAFGSLGMISRATKMNYLSGTVVGGGANYYKSVSNLSDDSDYNILEIKINAEVGIKQFRVIGGFSVEQSFILDSKAPPATKSEFIYLGFVIEVDELIQLFKHKK